VAGPVAVVDYDPQWPLLYEQGKNRILDGVGPKVLAIEHIGSTAVRGLGAKPITLWERQLRFRDFLRTHPDEAKRYCALKKELAERFRLDREAYTEAKAEFIESVVARARAERGSSR
jgi:GrpB-like predicted nucleotidyltransferase (UPF0157 family)